MDVVALRTEIKAWERDFKSNNGRDPTIQDIKDRPDIAEKYKLYKKLNKARTQPLTPPKRQSKQLISKSQAVIIEPPVASANPFSPVKNKANRALRVEQTRPLSNPFSTPRKEVKERVLSPDPFPLIQPVASSSQIALPSQPASAVSRARKRLRGEPVSPSPVKPKRPRVVPVGGPIPFLTKLSFNSDREHDYSDDEPSGKPGPAIFEETPRKDRSGNKSFTSLFYEDDRMTKPDFSLVTTRPQSALQGATASKPFTRTYVRGVKPSSSDEDSNGPAQAVFRAQSRAQLRAQQKPKPSDARTGPRERALNISSRLTSSKGHNALRQGSRALRSPSPSGTSGVKSNASTAPSTPDHDVPKLPPTSSAPTSDAEMGEDSDSINDRKDNMTLVPVSPPPPSLMSTRGYAGAKVTGKGKAKFASGAGKRKGKGQASAEAAAWVPSGDDSHDGLDDEGDLPVIRIYQGRNTSSKADKKPDTFRDREEEEVTKDLVSGIKRRTACTDPDLSSFPSQIQPQDGDMVVNLRDEFRTVLDLNANAAPLETAGGGISRGDKGEYARHARVVRAVRDGTRVIGMFDPSRGGHIWGVGETEHEADADLGTEDFQLNCSGGGDYDDWEGEGVPWEVAELEHDDDETRS